MSDNILLCNAELNKKYKVTGIKGDDTQLSKYGIYDGSPVTPLFRSMSKGICAYRTHYGIFAIRNDTARMIEVKYEE